MFGLLNCVPIIKILRYYYHFVGFDFWAFHSLCESGNNRENVSCLLQTSKINLSISNKIVEVLERKYSLLIHWFDFLPIIFYQLIRGHSQIIFEQITSL